MTTDTSLTDPQTLVRSPATSRGGYNTFAGLGAGGFGNPPTNGYPAAIPAAESAFGTTCIGYLAGAGGMTGAENTGVGWHALNTLTTGAYNTGVGINALGHMVSGNQNTGVGADALRNPRAGSYNNAFGFQALNGPGDFSSTGNRNAAIGGHAMTGYVTNSDNIAIGYDTLRYPTSGDQNVAIGNFSMRGQASTTAERNVAVGFQSMHSTEMTTAKQNVAVGWRAGYRLTSGMGNTAIGFSAGGNLTDQSDQTLIGNFAGSQINGGLQNVSVGSRALNSDQRIAPRGTTALGFGAGYGAGGSFNTLLGWQAGQNITGDYNVIIGANVAPADLSKNNQLVIGSNGIATISGKLATSGNNAALQVAGTLTPLSGLKLPYFTVATLPPAVAYQDVMVVVSDAMPPSADGVLIGGGSSRTPVYSDGRTWRPLLTFAAVAPSEVMNSSRKLQPEPKDWLEEAPAQDLKRLRAFVIGLVIAVVVIAGTIFVIRDPTYELLTTSTLQNGQAVNVYECRAFTWRGRQNKPVIKDEVTGEHRC